MSEQVRRPTAAASPDFPSRLGLMYVRFLYFFVVPPHYTTIRICVVFAGSTRSLWLITTCLAPNIWLLFMVLRRIRLVLSSHIPLHLFDLFQALVVVGLP